MTKKLPLFFILAVSSIVAFMHLVGMYLHLYWRLDYYDKPVHFLGGFLVAYICLIIIYFKRMPHVNKSHVYLVGLFAALMIGLAWEVFELRIGLTAFGDYDFYPNNTGDVLADLLGGIVATWYFIQTYKNSEKIS
jgi:hypothetical protein